MSLHKISNILEQNESFINVNLYSEQLRTILNQLVDMVSQQDQRISKLEAAVKQKAEKEDLEPINNVLNNFNESYVRDLVDQTAQRMTEAIANSNNAITENIDQKNNALEEKMQKLENTLNERFHNNEQNISIQVQRINDLSKNSRIMLERQDEFQGGLTAHHNRLVTLEGKSEDALMKRIEEQHNTIVTIKSDTENDIKIISGKINEAISLINVEKENMAIKVKDLDEKIIDIQGKIAAESLVQLELSDPLDASMIIHAIQRNDRRVDLLNQSFINTQNMCTEQAKFFNGIHRCLVDLSKEVALLGNDLNTTKEQIPACVKNTIRDISKIKSNIDSLTEVINATYKATSNALTDLNDRLVETEELTKNRTSNKIGFTDIINSLGRAGSGFQKLIDESVKLQSKASDITLEKSETRVVAIPSLNVGEQAAVETDDRATFEIEMNKKFAELNSRFDSESSQVTEFKKEMALLLDKKADMDTVDRIIEKLRSSINNVKEKLNHIHANTKMGSQIQPEIDQEPNYLRSRKLKPNTAHPSQSTFGKPLPPLPTSAQAYDIIYK